MRILTCCFLLIFHFKSFAKDPAIQDIRLRLHNSTSDEKTCRDLIKLLEPYNETNNPLFLGYKAGATMIMAKHVINPFSKFSFFKKGRVMLERAIKADEQNVELRFLRYTIQTNVPAFLGYNNQLKNDYPFLKKALPTIRDTGLKKIIKSYLEQKNPNYIDGEN